MSGEFLKPGADPIPCDCDPGDATVIDWKTLDSYMKQIDGQWTIVPGPGHSHVRLTGKLGVTISYTLASALKSHMKYFYGMAL